MAARRELSKITTRDKACCGVPHDGDETDFTNASAPVTVTATAVVNMSFRYNWPTHD